jgi:hypothetical protein
VILPGLAFFGIFSFRFAHDPMVKQDVRPAKARESRDQSVNQATR